MSPLQPLLTLQNLLNPYLTAQAQIEVALALTFITLYSRGPQARRETAACE